MGHCSVYSGGMTTDRSYVSKCVAKAIAYKECGNDAEAARWARLLIVELELAEILQP